VKCPVSRVSHKPVGGAVESDGRYHLARGVTVMSGRSPMHGDSTWMCSLPRVKVAHGAKYLLGQFESILP
jgi:hypothetical protein